MGGPKTVLPCGFRIERPSFFFLPARLSAATDQRSQGDQLTWGRASEFPSTSLVPVGAYRGGRRIHMQDRRVPSPVSEGNQPPPLHTTSEGARGGNTDGGQAFQDGSALGYGPNDRGRASLTNAHFSAPTPNNSPDLRPRRWGTPPRYLQYRRMDWGFTCVAWVAPQTHRPTFLRAGLGMYGKSAQKPTKDMPSTVACISPHGLRHE